MIYHKSKKIRICLQEQILLNRGGIWQMLQLSRLHLSEECFFNLPPQLEVKLPPLIALFCYTFV